MSASDKRYPSKTHVTRRFSSIIPPFAYASTVLSWPAHREGYHRVKSSSTWVLRAREWLSMLISVRGRWIVYQKYILPCCAMLILDKLEDNILALEKRRITQEEGRKAQAAMQALNVTNAPAPKAEDVDFVVSIDIYDCPVCSLTIGRPARHHPGRSRGSIEGEQGRFGQNSAHPGQTTPTCQVFRCQRSIDTVVTDTRDTQETHRHPTPIPHALC